jgi:hypothetical protein
MPPPGRRPLPRRHSRGSVSSKPSLASADNRLSRPLAHHRELPRECRLAFGTFRRNSRNGRRSNLAPRPPTRTSSVGRALCLSWQLATEHRWQRNRRAGLCRSIAPHAILTRDYGNAVGWPDVSRLRGAFSAAAASPPLGRGGRGVLSLVRSRLAIAGSLNCPAPDDESCFGGKVSQGAKDIFGRSIRVRQETMQLVLVVADIESTAP